MKQLSTKTLGSLLVVSIRATRDTQARKAMRQLDRALRRHDRKCELRAGILGITPILFKEMQKKQGFDEIIKKYGFKDPKDFYTALFGKLKNELLYRGWSRQRIDEILNGKVAQTA